MKFQERPDCYLDIKTGLEWSKENFGPMSWDEAMKQFDDSDGWRLPTIDELLTLVDHDGYKPATELPGMVSSYYWSSTTHADYTNYAWLVYFSNGYDNHDYKFFHYYVRAVRGGKEK